MPLLIVIFGILLLFILIARFKLDAFISFIIVCIFVGLFQGMQLQSIVESIQKGIGDTLGFLVLILGFAALVGWNLDLAAIAGIIAAVGTGVDDQIVITDEVMYGRKNQEHWLKRMKNAFFIIFAAYFTMLVAMLPLWFLGAGVLRGFALTTIVGVTIGVFVTRPAYAKMLEVLMEKDE